MTTYETRKGIPRIVPPKSFELSAGVPGHEDPSPQRDSKGRFIPGTQTKLLARKAGKASAETAKLGKLLGLSEVPDDHPLYLYQRLAKEFRDAHMKELAQNVGGGIVGAAPASIISTAGLQLAASRWLFDEGTKGADASAFLAASKLADASRQNLLAAHELTAREAKAREKIKPAENTPWLTEGTDK